MTSPDMAARCSFCPLQAGHTGTHLKSKESDIDAIRARHNEYPRGTCATCQLPWPCDAAIVLEREARLRRVAGDLLAAWPNIVAHPRLDNSEVAAIRAALAEPE